jgi:hypothetical protein
MTTVYVGYSPNDFFYQDVSNINIKGVNNLSPSDQECTTLLSQKWDSSACNVWFSDNSANCIKYQVCKNKINAENIYAEDTAHNSAYVNHIDNRVDFENTFLNMINLGIGILFIIFVIFKVQSMSKMQKS